MLLFVVVKRIKTSLSALVSKFKLRIILAAPVKEGFAVELAFAFEALKVRSADVPKVGVELQLVVVPKFPDVAPVQVCARAQGTTTTAPAARASKTAIRIRRREANAGLEFIEGGRNGVRRAGMRTVKRLKERTAEIPSPPAEQACKRRKRLLNDRGTGNHIWGNEWGVLGEGCFTCIHKKPTEQRSQEVYCNFFKRGIGQNEQNWKNFFEKG